MHYIGRPNKALFSKVKVSRFSPRASIGNCVGRASFLGGKSVPIALLLELWRKYTRQMGQLSVALVQFMHYNVVHENSSLFVASLY